jgi:hypothetical protein
MRLAIAMAAAFAVLTTAMAGEGGPTYVEEWRGHAGLEKHPYVHVRYPQGYEEQAELLQWVMINAGYTRSSVAAMDFIDFFLVTPAAPMQDRSHTITFEGIDVLFGPPGAGEFRPDPAHAKAPELPGVRQLPPADAQVVTVEPRTLSARFANVYGAPDRNPEFSCTLLPQPGLAHAPMTIITPALRPDQVNAPKARHLRLVLPRVDLGRPDSASVWVRVRVDIDGGAIEYTSLVMFFESRTPFEPCQICAGPFPDYAPPDTCLDLAPVTSSNTAVPKPPTDAPAEAPNGVP